MKGPDQSCTNQLAKHFVCISPLFITVTKITDGLMAHAIQCINTNHEMSEPMLRHVPFPLGLCSDGIVAIPIVVDKGRELRRLRGEEGQPECGDHFDESKERIHPSHVHLTGGLLWAVGRSAILVVGWLLPLPDAHNGRP